MHCKQISLIEARRLFSVDCLITLTKLLRQDPLSKKHCLQETKQNQQLLLYFVSSLCSKLRDWSSNSIPLIFVSIKEEKIFCRTPRSKLSGSNTSKLVIQQWPVTVISSVQPDWSKLADILSLVYNELSKSSGISVTFFCKGQQPATVHFFILYESIKFTRISSLTAVSNHRLRQDEREFAFNFA